MDQKSAVDILKNLQECVAQGIVSVEQFPVNDIMGIINRKHEFWLADLKNEWYTYEVIYEKSIHMAIDQENVDALVRLMEELIYDLEAIPKRENFVTREGGIKELKEKFKRLVIHSYQEYAKRAYEKYPFHFQPKKSVFHGKGVVYTVITGGYDILCKPAYIDSEFDYICFTDDPKLQSDIWSIRYVENLEKIDNIRLSRKYKILSHEFLKEYDYSIYVDGKMQIIGDMRKYMERYSCGSSMLCFPHFVRSCAYEEAKVCVEKEKDVPEVIREQMKGYWEEGYPADNGLVDCACLVRWHHDSVLQKTMKCWWDEVQTKSRRDQLSVGYACWKNEFHYDLSDLYIYQNEYIQKSGNHEK